MATRYAVASGNENIGVYKIVSPSGKIYIGSSINLKRRFSDYRRLKCISQPKLYNSLKKHGVTAHIFEIVLNCEIPELFKYERYYGLQYNVLGKNGLNHQLPSDGEFPQIQSKELREKKRQIQTGKKYSEESKKKMSLSKKGKPSKSTTKFKKGQISFFKGKKKSHETIEKTRQKLIGRHLTEEHKKKLAIASSKRVWSTESREKLSNSKKNHTVSIKTKLKISNSSLGKCGNNMRSIKVFNFNGIEISTYSSITEASRVLKIGRRSINNNLSKLSNLVNSSIGKLKFEYND